jgi:hypothetical protein
VIGGAFKTAPPLKKRIESVTRNGGITMIKMKSLMPIILLSIFLVTGTASAATLTPVGTCNGQDKVDVTLAVDDVTGIIGYDITVTAGSGLTVSTSDVSKTGSIAASWLVWSVTSPSTGVIRILAAGGTGSGSTGAGNLGKITCTATDGTVNTETVSVVVNEVEGGTLTPAAMTPVDCSGTTACSEWDDVIAKYNAYVGGTAVWADVIACYSEYVAAP